jgi:hypothetical protein
MHSSPAWALVPGGLSFRVYRLVSSGWWWWRYVCVCVCVCVCVRVRVCACACPCMCMCVCVCVFVHACVSRKHTNIQFYKQICWCVCLRLRTVWCVRAYPVWCVRHILCAYSEARGLVDESATRSLSLHPHTCPRRRVVFTLAASWLCEATIALCSRCAFAASRKVAWKRFDQLVPVVASTGQ